MRATLIFPPATDPRAPHLALPCLAAVLRPAGVETRLIDADLTSLLALLRPKAIAEHLRRLRRKARAGGIDPDLLWRLLARGEALVEEMPRALATLRDRTRFYDAHAFQAAREALLDGVELASAAAAREVRYDLCPIRYDVAGIDERSLADLVAATGDPAANLFEAYWQDELIPDILAGAPDFVGLSIVNRQQILPGLTLARRLKARGLFVVIGGTVFTKFVDELRARPTFFAHFADGVVVYEGEAAVLALAEALRADGTLEKVPNLLFLDRGAVRMGPTHVETVEALPTPDFDGLPLAEYLSPEPVLPILVGKGCYFNACKFCDIPFINHVSRKPYRVRSPERIAQDVLSLNARHGCRHFEITDEALPPRLLDRLANALAPHADRDLSFTGYARLEPGFSASLCEKLARMGMRKLFFGLESGDQDTLDHMRKGIRLEHVRPVLSHCRAAGIDVHVFSIVGFPEETEASARNTLRFFEDNADLLDAPGNSFDIHPFGLELRTPYHREAGRHGIGLPEAVLAKDFVIGVGEDWTNARGLTRAQAGALVEQYDAALKRLYPRFHNSPMHLWPGFEEYAILYAGHYRDHAFPFRTCLPPLGDPTRFVLTWNPAAALERRGDRVRIASRWQTVELGTAAFRTLGTNRPRTVGGLLAECAALDLVGPADDPADRLAQLRTLVDLLIGSRLLQIRLIPEEAEKAGGVPAAAWMPPERMAESIPI